MWVGEPRVLSLSQCNVESFESVIVFGIGELLLI